MARTMPSSTPSPTTAAVGEQGHGELVFPDGQDAPHPGQVDELDRDQEDHRGQGGLGQVGQRPGQQQQDDQDHARPR